MKLVTFQIAGKPDLLPGLFTDRGVVSLADAVPAGATPTATMTGIIDNFDRLRPALERLARDGKALPIADVRLRAPLPRPGKILACIANYWEHGALEARPLNMFLKSADAGSARRHDRAAGVHRAVDLHARGRAGAGHQGAGEVGQARQLAHRRLRLHRHDRRVGAR